MNARLATAVGLFVAAAALDLGAHVTHATAVQQPAHVAALLGMVATLATVVTNGISRTRSTRR